MAQIRIGVELLGEREVQRAFKKNETRARAALEEAIRKPSEMVAEEAGKSTAFKDRVGELRDSFKAVRDRKRKNDVSFKVGSTARHFHLVDQGHVVVVKTRDGKKRAGFVAARPIIVPALQRKEREAIRLAAQTFRKAMRL